MADCADTSDDKIDAIVIRGRYHAQQNSLNFKLQPIILEVPGETYGVCHWCESPIRPGTLFCLRDPRDTGMCCSESWEHTETRRKAIGNI